MAIAKESVLVAATNCSTSVGLVYVESVPKVFSSSMPANVPSSDSTETSNLWA